MGRPLTVLSEDERKAVVACYRRTGNLRQTAQSLGRGESTIRRVLAEAGVEYQTKRSGWEQKMREVPASYRALGSVTRVASLLSLTTAHVAEALDAAGIEWRKSKAESQGTMRKVIKQTRSLSRAKKGLDRDDDHHHQ
jgi:hypothetical protein